MFRRLLIVILFSIAFAYIESAVVVYLRVIFHSDGFSFPLPVFDLNPLWRRLILTEIGREAATMVIIATGAWLLGRSVRERWAYGLTIFAVWDIFYYVWLNVLNAKITQLKLANVRTQLIDLDKGDALEGRYHLIVSSMTLHHIRDIAILFDRFSRVLAPGGCLVLADLDSEGGLFHSDNTGVFHFGFDRTTLCQTLKDAKFEAVEDTIAAEMVKPTATGETRRFTVFLMTSRRR